MSNSCKLLFLEDVPTDVELILREFKKSGINSINHLVVQTGEAFQSAILTFQPDAIISDYSLPGFDAMEALDIRNKIAPQTPFILATGAQTEEVAVNCIKKGADDYILKSSLTRIPTAVTHAIEKKEAEKNKKITLQKLKENEEKYRNLFENSLIGMFRADGNSCLISDANKKTEEILGIDTFTGVSLKEVFCNSSQLEEFCSQIKIQEKIDNLEFQIIKDNSPAWVALSARYFSSEDIIEGTLVDITEKKNNLIQLEKVNNELERFAYHASHDLRSPLKSVMGLIAAMRDENMQDGLNDYINLLEKSAEKMDNLINDLLTMARLSRLEFLNDLIDFSFELPEIVESLSFLNNSSRVNVISEVNTEFLFSSDKVRICTILRNLIGNALKYHSCIPGAFVKISIQITREYGKIIIEDNGKGIEPAHQNKIFDMFYRATSDSEGSGLGLYIVKTTVDALNGNLEMESQWQKGTTFTLTIPNLYYIKEEISLA